MDSEIDSTDQPGKQVLVDVDVIHRMKRLIELQQAELDYLRQRVRSMELAKALLDYQRPRPPAGRPRTRKVDAEIELLIAVEEEMTHLGLRSRRAVLQHVLDQINARNALNGRPRRNSTKDARHMKTLLNRLSEAAKRQHGSAFPENTE